MQELPHSVFGTAVPVPVSVPVQDVAATGTGIEHYIMDHGVDGVVLCGGNVRIG